MNEYSNNYIACKSWSIFNFLREFWDIYLNSFQNNNKIARFSLFPQVVNAVNWYNVNFVLTILEILIL